MAKRSPWKATTAPFGPASTFSTPASRHSRLMAMISSRFSTSARQRAEAVDQFRGEGVDLAPVEQRGDAAIEAEPHIEIGDIALGDQHGRADGDLRRPFLGRFVRCCAPLRARGDRLFEQVLVKLDADLADMARLLLAQEIAGAADVEIVARQREAGAELIQGLHHFEPALRRLGQQLAARAGSR